MKYTDTKSEMNFKTQYIYIRQDISTNRDQLMIQTSAGGQWVNSCSEGSSFEPRVGSWIQVIMRTERTGVELLRSRFHIYTLHSFL